MNPHIEIKPQNNVITFSKDLRAIEKKYGIKFNMSITDDDIRRTKQLIKQFGWNKRA